MKVLHINKSDIKGGAARATYRIHRSLIDYKINSRLLVDQKFSDDWTVICNSNKLKKTIGFIKHNIVKIINKTLKTDNYSTRSLSIFSSKIIDYINASDADIVHLHWIQGEMISIEQIPKIKKPIVWTLHDMWPFCGAEHYTDDYRWKNKYMKYNRPHNEKGIDLNRWCWERKCKNWKLDLNIVCPSSWMVDCAKQSAIFEKQNIFKVPNPIDINIWKPLNKNIARSLLNFSQDENLLLFGAIGGGDDPRKGFDLLTEAIIKLTKYKTLENIRLVVFGQSEPKFPPDYGFPVNYLGHLNDDLSLKVVYSACDVMVVPSRAEAFGQTASEANSCGLPVVAFSTGGLKDIVEQKKSGFLAKAFDTEDLAFGIKWVLENNLNNKLSKNSRRIAIENFSYSVVAKSYYEIYRKIKG